MADLDERVVVGLVLECEAVSDSLKRLSVDVGGERTLQIVTNAPNVQADKRVVVAQVGAVVRGEAVTKATIRGVPSEGMLCDAPMLGWVGGGAGTAALVPGSFAPGDPPPASRPRLDQPADAAPAPPAAEVQPLFAKKLSKEEKKAAAAARKAEREAKKQATTATGAPAGAADDAVDDEDGGA